MKIWLWMSQILHLEKENKKDLEVMTSYDLLKRALIKKGIPEGTKIEEIMPDSPKGKLSHDIMFGDWFKNENEESSKNLLKVKQEISKEKEDKIALITGK